MGTTPIYQLPYPEAVDPADVPLDMRELAERLEAIKAGAGAELAYAQITATVNITATSEATAQTIVSAPATTFAAEPILVEFYCPIAQLSNVGVYFIFQLFDGATNLGRYALMYSAVVNDGVPIHAVQRLTPTAGSHTYSVRAFVGAGNGLISAGPGGPGVNPMAAFIRISRV
jgi:hypothetical protein